MMLLEFSCVKWMSRFGGLRVGSHEEKKGVRNVTWACMNSCTVFSQVIQWSLYFKATLRTKKMWSYITGGLKVKVI